MFKIDKSSVEFLDANRFLTVLPPHEQTGDAARQKAAQHPAASAKTHDFPKASKGMPGESGHKKPSQAETAPQDAQAEAEKALALAKSEAERIRTNAEAAAAKLLEDAKYDSFRIVHEAETRAEQIRMDAWHKGYAEGMELLNKEGEAQKTEFEGFMRSILSQTNQFTQAVNAAFEENVLRLC
ncbi:MAG TPA: hypothetical protein VN366_12390, partial [Feifaniaceae bacterium]|nr:hypothetical protein [Feifaniaceae bacterium]